jgi:alanyl-tRNA synthetase
VSWSASALRDAFTGFFRARGHEVVASASLVPSDPSILFTIAGMVPFKPYFLGIEPPPFTRATSVQRCLRTLDIDVVGTTDRHCTFFEMLGNFSFGDYFKSEAIQFAWELLTQVLFLDADRLWVTVYEDDDEAEAIWRDQIGVPSHRIQRMGEDNFWRMGDTGPCGPCSEIYFDRGEALGEGGGPALGGPERYVEIWNLVFMQYERLADGSMQELPKRNIDTGAGLERILPILEGVPSMFDTDVFAPVMERARSLLSRQASNVETLRVMADHARAATWLVTDGVLPSNEGRGYVLRRLVRRAVLRAERLGVEKRVMVPLVEGVVEAMGEAYPQLAEQAGLVSEVLDREEAGFRERLATGMELLEREIATGIGEVSGELAFKLFDTHGFPLDLTREVAEERGLRVDVAGYEAAMEAQRARARASAAHSALAGEDSYAEIASRFGRSEFFGYDSQEGLVKVIAVLEKGPGSEVDRLPTSSMPGSLPTGSLAVAGSRGPDYPESGQPPRLVEIFLDRTPFYPEGGGQVGDVGWIISESGRARVIDTSYAVPGVIRHTAWLTGTMLPGQEVQAIVDSEARSATARHHTGTHLVHWALREVLGAHVRQQGSLVTPERLRFDFTHFSPMASEEIEAVEDLVDHEILTDEFVRSYETTKKEAQARGALAFFGDKYGERVRVVEAGTHSVELCGGTHVGRLGMIGPVLIVSEGSIGSSTRRIEALAGSAALTRIREMERQSHMASRLLNEDPLHVSQGVERLIERQRKLEAELREIKERQSQGLAEQLARSKGDSAAVVARRDGVSQEELRKLAMAVRSFDSVDAVVIGGVPEEGKVALVVALGEAATAKGLDAVSLVRQAGEAIKGGGGGSANFAQAGGRNPAGLDAALSLLAETLGASYGGS